MRKGHKKIVVFDLDGTVIDSTHRTPNNPDGTLDLQGYYKNRTRRNIFKDTLLPLAEVMKERYRDGNYHVVVCTAREIDQDDLDFLEYHGLKYHEILERNNCRKKYHWGLSDPEYKTKQLKEQIIISRPRQSCPDDVRVFFRRLGAHLGGEGAQGGGW